MAGLSTAKPLAYQVYRLHEELQGLIEERFSVLWPHSEELEARRKDVVAFLCPRGCPVDGKLLDQFPSLKVVSNHGVGCDHIDVSACSVRGITLGRQHS